MKEVLDQFVYIFHFIVFVHMFIKYSLCYCWSGGKHFYLKDEDSKVLGLKASNSRERLAIVGKKVYCISEFFWDHVCS